MKYEYKKQQIVCKNKECKLNDKKVIIESDDDKLYKRCPICKGEIKKLDF